MKKTAAAIITALLIATGVLLALSAPAAEAGSEPCYIRGSGTTKTSFGCARMTNTRRGGGTIKVQDTDRNGRCVRVKTLNSNYVWSDMGISHCTLNRAGYYSIRAIGGGDILAVRIYDGWSSVGHTVRY